MSDPTPASPAPSDKPKLTVRLPGSAPASPAPGTPPDDDATVAAPAPKPVLRSAPPPPSADDVNRATKLPGYAPPKFTSPMPAMDQSEEPTPAYQAVIAAVACVAAIAFAVLLYLKNQ